jgi:hypothetical protein
MREPCAECDGHGEYILDTTNTELTQIQPCEYCAMADKEYYYE